MIFRARNVRSQTVTTDATSNASRSEDENSDEDDDDDEENYRRGSSSKRYVLPTTRLTFICFFA